MKKKYNFSRDEMINEVRQNTKTGKTLIKVEKEWFNAIKNGNLMKLLTKKI